MELPTLAVECDDSPSGYQIINEMDYDEAKHRLYNPSSEPVKKRKAKSHVGINDSD